MKLLIGLLFYALPAWGTCSDEVELKDLVLSGTNNYDTSEARWSRIDSSVAQQLANLLRIARTRGLSPNQADALAHLMTSSPIGAPAEESDSPVVKYLRSLSFPSQDVPGQWGDELPSADIGTNIMTVSKKQFEGEE